MRDLLVTIVISSITSILVAAVPIYLTVRSQRRTKTETLNTRYLHPLRQYAVDYQLRLSEIENQPGQRKHLGSIREPQELTDKKIEWFDRDGHYLLSSVYSTACLFAQLTKLRNDVPYLRLRGVDDTHLLRLMQRVNIAFAGPGGVYYTTQFSIGEDLLHRKEGRLKSYREFCELLHNPAYRVWMDGLIDFYLAVERSNEAALDRVDRVLVAVEKLLTFLDDVVGGGESITGRRRAEIEAREGHTTQ